MDTVTDPAAPTSHPDHVPTTSSRWRRTALIASGVVLVVIALALASRPKAATPEQFATFSQKLGTLSAPAGSFTPYDPTRGSSLGSVPQGSWSLTGTDTWSSTQDPSWWASVRGWETTVAVGQERAVCDDALAWLASSGSELGLTTPGPDENLTTCLSVLDSVRTDPGNVNNAWGVRGTQTGDGQLRYRTGLEAFTGERPGDVVVRLTADATVANQ